jgi:hypothetical protein
MAHDDAADQPPIAGYTVSGGSYQGVVTGDGVQWLCPHVHFTQQSARTCADRYVTKRARAAARGGSRLAE